MTNKLNNDLVELKKENILLKKKLDSYKLLTDHLLKSVQHLSVLSEHVREGNCGKAMDYVENLREFYD